MALAAISVTTVTVLNSYLTTRYDAVVREIFNTASTSPQNVFGGYVPGYAYPLRIPNAVAGIQLAGTPLSPAPGNGLGGGILPGRQATPVPDVPVTQTWASENAGKLITLGSRSGRELWRTVVEPITYNGQSATLVVAYDLGPVNDEIRRLVTIELIVGGVIVVVLAVVAVAVVQANLRPLNDIEMTAGQIAKGHLNHRIPERDPRTEIGSLGRSLNAMLAQIEAAFHDREKSERAAHESEERMRRFIADASHELRTPLTTIRGFAEYYRQRKGQTPATQKTATLKPATLSSLTNGGDSPAPGGSLASADIDRIMKRLESEAARMGLLVEDLLQLARLDQQRPLDLAPVDLLSLAADAVQDARMVAADRTIDLVIDQGTAFIVNGDEPRLRQVLANLVNNALTHTPAGTPVRVKLSSGPLNAGDTSGANGTDSADSADGAGRPAIVLDVEDDGPGLTAEQAQHIFERFYRADAARNRASGGTGLGLAIVAGLVKAHGGTVSVTSAPGQGADFQVRLPLSPDAAADA
ncbi:MAG: HAMP domain-containing histidine kinase [Nocardiopsaceae bacterium]|nr:HAMP domain-containing histidine kinase [Nocardiopsaceae bacterium]